ncbi:hypothetical protein DSL72_005602 [Monilinia vaccinii-corymbosi]|uniref:Ubiquitin 3 binding protein But2 C-terminal domain-containing protein n=1 Tax=Monilinia vaccinii-corymbosi TaxID=61207 RepID=A0A8A3PFK6_9HELO|nr:hypothetical protein DSL72_005602 [Monilinia vaccinii-corymbosi]
MFSKTLLGLLVGAASFVQASPVLNEKRGCQRIFPNQLVQLSEASPDSQYPNTWNTDKSVKISQDIDKDGKPTNQYWELIAFPALPAGSYGCSLTITFPSGNSPLIQGVSPALNVYTVSTPLPYAPTYNNICSNIKPGIFGTITPSKGQCAVINTESCNGGSGQGLAYIFRYADWVRTQGSVCWNQCDDASNTVGVYMDYNC